MRSINLQETKTHLSRLVEEAAGGKPSIIAKAGKPMVQVIPLAPLQPAGKPRRMGFMEGESIVPDDFDTMFSGDIERMFHG